MKGALKIHRCMRAYAGAMIAVFFQIHQKFHYLSNACWGFTILSIKSYSDWTGVSWTK